MFAGFCQPGVEPGPELILLGVVGSGSGSRSASCESGGGPLSKSARITPITAQNSIFSAIPVYGDGLKGQ
jgi:hypothetical protein